MELFKKNTGKGGPNSKRFVWVVLSFVSLSILLDLIVWYLGRREYLAFLDIFTSWIITGLIHLSGLQAVRDSNTIYLTNSVWIMSVECTAIYIMLIYTSFIAVYPAKVKSKAFALLSGIPFIFGANIMRLFIMAWIDKLKPQYTDYFHNYVWQGVFIVMVIFIWLVWIEKVVVRETETQLSS